MPPPTREQFNAAAAKVAASAKPGLSRDDFYNLIDHELAKPSSYGDDVLSTLKGEGEGLYGGLTAPFLHPIDTATAAYNTVRHPIDTAKGIGKVLTEGSAEDLGSLVGNVAGGAILGKVATGVPRLVKGVSRIAPDVAATSLDAAKAGVRFVPRVEKVVGAFEDAKAARTARQASQLRDRLGVESYGPPTRFSNAGEYAEGANTLKPLPPEPEPAPVAKTGHVLTPQESALVEELFKQEPSTTTHADQLVKDRAQGAELAQLLARLAKGPR